MPSTRTPFAQKYIPITHIISQGFSNIDIAGLHIKIQNLSFTHPDLAAADLSFDLFRANIRKQEIISFCLPRANRQPSLGTDAHTTRAAWEVLAVTQLQNSHAYSFMVVEKLDACQLCICDHLFLFLSNRAALRFLFSLLFFFSVKSIFGTLGKVLREDSNF